MATSSTGAGSWVAFDPDAFEIRVAAPEQDPASHRRIGDREYVRDADPDGLWRYAGSGIPVPGARDLTAEGRFKPRRALDAEGRPSEYIIDVQRLDTTVEELGWLHDIGSVVTDRDGHVTAVIVTPEDWGEHRSRLFGLTAPEIDGSPAARELAEAERRARITTAVADRAMAERNRLLLEHARALTRREAAAIAGLSAARVQQILDRGPAEAEPDHAPPPEQAAASLNWWQSTRT
jgi:hypothetical protein